MKTGYSVETNAPMMPWMQEGYYNVNKLCPPQPCIPQETVLRNLKLARAYVPFQKFCTIFSPEEGLKKGTAFPELYEPYIHKEMVKVQMPMQTHMPMPKIIQVREEVKDD